MGMLIVTIPMTEIMKITFSRFHPFSPRFHLKKAKSENVNDEQNDVHSLKGDSNNSIYIEGTSPFHPNPVSYSNPVSLGEGCVCMGDIEKGENDRSKWQIIL